MPVLDLRLEQVALGRFHIFCPILVPRSDVGDILEIILIKKPQTFLVRSYCTNMQ